MLVPERRGLLHRDYRLTTRHYDEAFEAMCRTAGFAPNIVFRTDDYQSVQGLATAHVGLVIVPRLSMTAQRPDITARLIHKPAFMRRIDAVTLPQSQANPLALRLHRLLAETWTEAADHGTPTAREGRIPGSGW
ncbi:MAG: LysR substrate-binding domain-containing protein [Hyphomicrobiaceae bacterium]